MLRLNDVHSQSAVQSLKYVGLVRSVYFVFTTLSLQESAFAVSGIATKKDAVIIVNFLFIYNHPFLTKKPYCFFVSCIIALESVYFNVKYMETNGQIAFYVI